mmetsp:Transcript_3028/g.3565  ORF Transcript_3028/g.3565 Transcript_3028/m.3565 type:complete len:81 (+) Transcript_3028:119-361(+)
MTMIITETTTFPFVVVVPRNGTKYRERDRSNDVHPPPFRVFEGTLGKERRVRKKRSSVLLRKRKEHFSSIIKLLLCVTVA